MKALALLLLWGRGGLKRGQEGESTREGGGREEGEEKL
jgi:hypothetical protein